jgi:peptidoglycan/LPS O-acetylase OafA/YrhL
MGPPGSCEEECAPVRCDGGPAAEPPLTSSSDPRYLAGLDVLRGLAILIVITWHYPSAGAPAAFETISRFGWTGVELFFVLSGFLIGSQLFEPVAQGAAPSLGRFYLRRAFRILPNFLVVLAVYLFLPDLRERALVTPWWRFLTFTQNFGLHLNAFSHAWSLCVEEHFYLVLPLLVLALRRARGTWVVMGAAGLVLLGALLRWALWTHLFAGASEDAPVWRDYDCYLYYPTYARLDGLICGAVLALVRVFRPALWERVTRKPVVPALLGLALLATGAWLCADRTSLRSTVFVFPMLAFGYAALVAAMAGPAASRFCARLPGVRTFAALTFAIYLTHKMVIHAVHDVLKESGHGAYDPLTVLACIPAVLAAAWVLHRAVEQPMLRLRGGLERSASRRALMQV